MLLGVLVTPHRGGCREIGSRRSCNRPGQTAQARLLGALLLWAFAPSPPETERKE